MYLDKTDNDKVYQDHMKRFKDLDSTCIFLHKRVFEVDVKMEFVLQDMLRLQKEVKQYLMDLDTHSKDDSGYFCH